MTPGDAGAGGGQTPNRERRRHGRARAVGEVVARRRSPSGSAPPQTTLAKPRPFRPSMAVCRPGP